MASTLEGDATLQRARQIPTTLLSDILGDLGRPAQALSTGIQSVHPGVERVAGWAYTVVGESSVQPPKGPDMDKARAIDAMPEGSIAVWAGSGMTGVCIFGDLLASAMRVRGVQGAVVDGGVRDVDDIDPGKFPVFARYHTPRASTGVWKVTATQVEVEMPGTLGEPVVVAPRDLVVADQNGVLVIPSSLVEEALQRGEAHIAKEGEIRGKIEAGESVAGLLEAYGRI